MKKQAKTTDESAVWLERIRGRRRRRKIRLAVGITVILAAVLVYFTGLYGASIAMLGDVLDTISIALKPGESWPLQTDKPELLSAQPLSGSFLLLSGDDLTLYSNSGSQLRRIQHGYARPQAAAAGTRFCLYNRTGTQLRVESRTRTLYTKTFSQPILTADIASGGEVAVLTRSNRYTGELMLYDAQFEEIFHWYATEQDGTPYLMDLDDNGRMVVGCAAPAGGKMGLNVIVLNGSQTDPLASIRLEGCSGYRVSWLGGGRFAVITDTFVAVYDTKGEERARYDHAGTLLSADTSGGTLALLYDDGQLKLLDSSLSETGSASVSGAEKVMLADGRAYCLTKDSVYGFSLKGKSLGVQTFDSTPQAVFKAGKVLAAYGDSLDRLDLDPLPAPESSSSAE